MANFRKIQIAGFILAGVGSILLLIYLSVELEWLDLSRSKLFQLLGLALIIVGLSLNLYANQRATHQVISK